MQKLCCWLLGTMTLANAGWAVEPLQLSVKVEGRKSQQGQVVIRLFRDSETWLKKDAAVESVSVAGDAKDVEARFQVPPGTYAVAVFQDENSNGKLDMRWLPPGPAEPWVMSNNAQGMMGPPAFKDAMFELKADQALSLQLQ